MQKHIFHIALEKNKNWLMKSRFGIYDRIGHPSPEAGLKRTLLALHPVLVGYDETHTTSVTFD